MTEGACRACAARSTTLVWDDCTPVTVAEPIEDGWRGITGSGYSVVLPRRVVDPGLRLLRTGQRLHARRLGGVVVDAWLA